MPKPVALRPAAPPRYTRLPRSDSPQQGACSPGQAEDTYNNQIDSYDVVE